MRNRNRHFGSRSVICYGNWLEEHVCCKSWRDAERFYTMCLSVICLSCLLSGSGISPNINWAWDQRLSCACTFQHLIRALCRSPNDGLPLVHLLWRWTNVNPASGERLMFAVSWQGECTPANTRHWTNVGLMLAHRLRRRPNINPTLVQCLVLAEHQLTHETFELITLSMLKMVDSLKLVGPAHCLILW